MARAATVTKLQVKQDILSRNTVLGNSNLGFKEVCSDLVNNFRERGGQAKELTDGTFLSAATLDRISKLEDTETGNPYRPNADTCERILKFFGAEVSFNQVQVKSRFLNKPKVDL